MDDSVESQLYYAVQSGDIGTVSSLLKNNPSLDVNWKARNQWTALSIASMCCYVEDVKLLLAHPNVNVNMKGATGKTPFLLCCAHGHVSVVQLFLEDPRVDVTLDDEDGCTPLWWASYYGNWYLIEWLIASGRDLGDLNKKGTDWGDDKDYTALEIAKRLQRSEVVSVLERFTANPAHTRYEIQVELGMLDALAAEVFALTVFLCDDLLHLKPASHPAAAAAAATNRRFFTIAAKLPMELQMILCHRVVGSTKQNMLRKDSEAAFKSLARILLPFVSN